MIDTINVNIGLFIVLIEIICGLAVMLTMSILWMQKLRKHGYHKGKVYEYTCKRLGENKS